MPKRKLRSFYQTQRNIAVDGCEFDNYQRWLSNSDRNEFYRTLPNIIKVDNFKLFLIILSGIVDDGSTPKYAALKRMFQQVSFKQKAYTRGKVRALVAGSYPTFLAGKVKKYNDIDIFLLFTTFRDPAICEVWDCLEILSNGEGCRNADKHYEDLGLILTRGGRTGGQIRKIANVGKIQFILRDYEGCECTHHLDKIFFRNFHDVTRWKLVIFTIYTKFGKKDGILWKYIPYDEENGIITKRISISEGDGKYPLKHIDNKVDNFPPSLFQQSLLTIFKCNLMIPFIIW